MAHERITDKLHRRHVRLFRILSWICAPLFRRKMNYSWDDLSGIEGPYVLVCNHNTDYDPILLGLAASKQLYFVAGEQVTRNGFLFKLLDFVFAPIIHFKGKAGINTVSQMLRDLKSGYSVAIFPEGNRSFNGLTCSFAPTIGQLIRKSGAGLITYSLEGGYFTQPRWGFTLRRGKLNGRLMRYFDPEKLAGMTDDEINDAIKHDLYENAYETQSRERVPFKGKKMALGLETTLFMCPKCGKRAALFSTNDELKCSCGYSARFTEYGELIRTDESAPDKAAVTIAQLDTAQRGLGSSSERKPSFPFRGRGQSHAYRQRSQDRLNRDPLNEGIYRPRRARRYCPCSFRHIGYGTRIPQHHHGISCSRRSPIRNKGHERYVQCP